MQVPLPGRLVARPGGAAEDRLPVVRRRVAVAPADVPAATGLRDERFDPPHSTVHTGIIHGGTARNIIPKECYLNWEIRPLPGENADALVKRFTDRCEDYLKDMRKIYSDANIVTRPVSRMTAVTLPAHAGHAGQLVKHCAQSNQEFAVSFGTEAGIFNDYGIPAIVCGPGSITQAHQPNEYISLAQLDEGAAFMMRLADACS